MHYHPYIPDISHTFEMYHDFDNENIRAHPDQVRPATRFHQLLPETVAGNNFNDEYELYTQVYSIDSKSKFTPYAPIPIA